MNTNVRFAGHAVRREFRRGFSFHASLPPPDAPPHTVRRRTTNDYPIHGSGDNVSPHRRYRQYTLLYRVVAASYQGVHSWRPGRDWNDADTAVFMPRRARHRGDKQLINRIYRHAFKQQLAQGLEAPSEFRMPKSLHTLNSTW